jgi:hypothetical protein
MSPACAPIIEPKIAVATHSPMTTARNGSAAPKTRPKSTKDSAICQMAPPADHQRAGSGQHEQDGGEHVGGT